MSDQSKPSIEQLQSQIEATRARLAGTIDELTVRAQPKEIARRQTASLKASFTKAAYTPDGALRTERLVVVLAAVAAVLVAFGLLRRRRG
jgi:hypothetical protein